MNAAIGNAMMAGGYDTCGDTSNSDMKKVALNFRSANERCEGGLNPVILFNANHPGMRGQITINMI